MLTKYISILFLFSIIFTLNGCATKIPDTQPFLDASNQLGQSSQTISSSLSADLSLFELKKENCIISKENHDKIIQSEGLINQYLAGLKKASDVIAVISNYAKNLHDVAQTGINAETRFDNLTTKITKYSKDIHQIAEKTQYGVEANAAQDLLDSLLNVSNQIERNVEVHKTDKNLESLIKGQGEEIKNIVNTDLKAIFPDDKTITENLNTYTTKLNDNIKSACYPDEYNFFDNLNNARNEAIKNFRENDKSAARISTIESLIDKNNEFYNAIEKRRTDIITAFNNTADLIKKSATVLKSLADAHTNLADYLESNSGIGSYFNPKNLDLTILQNDVTQLKSAISEVKTIK